MKDGADDSDLIIAGQPEPVERAPDSRATYSWRAGAAASGPPRPRPSRPHAGAPVELPEDDVLMLDPYSEDDNAVTQEVAGLISEPRWLVQFTALDRRMMDTSDVISALLDGTIQRETLVWRGGMDDWVPVGRLDLLAQSAIPTLPPKRRGAGDAAEANLRALLGQTAHGRITQTNGPASTPRGMSGPSSVRARPLELTLASVAIALSAATITTSFLSIAGVFDTRRAATPTSVQALRAEPPPSERPKAPPPSLERDEPAPPDPDRATATAH